MDAAGLAKSALTHAEYSVDVLKKLVELLDSAVAGESMDQQIAAPKVQQPLEPEMTSINEWDTYFRSALDQLKTIKVPTQRRAVLVEMRELVEKAIQAIDNNQRINLED